MPGPFTLPIEKITSPIRLKAPHSYLLALLLVGIGALVRWSMPGVLHSYPFLAFYPVLVFAAAFGGLGPGILALSASWLCVTHYFDPTPGVIGLTDPAELGRLLVFVIGGLGVSIVSEAQLRGRERQAEQARKLRELNQLTDMAPFMVRNQRNEIVHWSNGCVLLYGFTPEQALGRISHDLLRTEFPEPPEKINDALRRTGSWQGELRQFRSDQTALTVSGQWVLQDRPSGPVVLEICTDITRLKETEESLRRTTAELKRSNEDLENFAYIASHDLQEPLRGINGFLTLLQQRYAPQLDSKANEYITFAVDGATRMSQLIHDLLRYSRLGRGDKDLKPTDTQKVLTEALSNLRGAVEEAGAEVTCDRLPFVLGNAPLLVQVFQNLIGNGIKFRNLDRPCRIHIACCRNETHWQFSVTDNGIGIEAEHYDRIFVIFKRLHNRLKYSGTGIGLAICKRIVERHGGKIWVESKAGEGSTFHFLLLPAGS